MSKIIVKQIPVSKHINKYLHYIYGSSYTYSRKDFLGNMIFGLMSKGYRLTYMCKLEEAYPIKLTKDDTERMGRFFEWDTCQDFNKGVDSFFRSSLYFHLDMQRKLGQNNVYPAMVQSLTEMNITENDILYDTLYRDYNRKCRYKKTTRTTIDYFENTSEDLSFQFGKTVQNENQSV